MTFTPDDVTLSTKCWERDYRTVLEPATIAALFDPFGPAARRQVVLNRIDDRAGAERRAQSLVDTGVIDAFGWAEDAWPALCARLDIPLTWFGPAWPFAAPELAELALATTPVLAHIAGDVRLDAGAPWLPRALPLLDGAAIVAPISPSRIELTRSTPDAHDPSWVRDHEISDQCFVAPVASLLAREVVRATHWTGWRYPKPGGALTFEARVGAWLRTTDRARAVDVGRSYVHPVGGAEGDAYPGLSGPREELPPLPEPSSAYPGAGSVGATGVVVVRDAVRTIAWTVRSLQWLRTVVVVDQSSTDGTAERARAAGADVRVTDRVTVSGNALRGELSRELGGWVVHLDGDEVCSPRLARAIADTIASGSADVVEAPQRTFVRGYEQPIEARRIRAHRAGSVQHPTGLEALRETPTTVTGARVHATPDDGAYAVVKLGPADLGEVIARTNDRTSLVARSTYAPRNVSLRRAAKHFALAYFRAGGWRRGREGWRTALLAAFTHWLTTEKAREQINGGAATVRAGYDELAAYIVEGTIRGSSVHPAEKPGG